MRPERVVVRPGARPVVTGIKAAEASVQQRSRQSAHPTYGPETRARPGKRVQQLERLLKVMYSSQIRAIAIAGGGRP